MSLEISSFCIRHIGQFEAKGIWGKATESNVRKMATKWRQSIEVKMKAAENLCQSPPHVWISASISHTNASHTFSRSILLTYWVQTRIIDDLIIYFSVSTIFRSLFHLCFVWPNAFVLICWLAVTIVGQVFIQCAGAFLERLSNILAIFLSIYKVDSFCTFHREWNRFVCVCVCVAIATTSVWLLLTAVWVYFSVYFFFALASRHHRCRCRPFFFFVVVLSSPHVAGVSCRIFLFNSIWSGLELDFVSDRKIRSFFFVEMSFSFCTHFSHSPRLLGTVHFIRIQSRC